MGENKMTAYKNLVDKVCVVSEKKTKQKDYSPAGHLALVDQGQPLIGGYTDDESLTVPCDLPVIVFGDHTRVVKYVSFPFGAGADGIKVLQPKPGVSPKFLYYVTQYLVLKLEDKGYARHYQYLEKKEVNLPSLPEQERIVAHIEELFSQLDSGVETLKKVKQQLAMYRQAVLKEAFSSATVKKPIREMSLLVTSGSRGWAKYYAQKGARFIRITDLTRERIDLKNDNIQYVSLPDNTEGMRSLLKPDDVLVSITADLGSIALIPTSIGDAYINQHIAMIRFLNSKQGKYMAWYLKSKYGQKDLLRNKRGGGKLGLGLDDIRNTPVPVVDDDTVAATLAQIDACMSICDSIEQTIDTALQQAETLRQSILRKAFEGEMV